MPWCDVCDKHIALEGYTEGTACGTCNSRVDSSDLAYGKKLKSPPWHFWVMVFALGVYLLWRLVEFVSWLVGKYV